MYNIHNPDFLSKEDLAIQWIYSGQLYHMFLYFYYYSLKSDQWFRMLCQAKAHLLFISKGKVAEGSWLVSYGTKKAIALGLLETVATNFRNKRVFAIFCSWQKKTVVTNHLEFQDSPPIS